MSNFTRISAMAIGTLLLVAQASRLCADGVALAQSEPATTAAVSVEAAPTTAPASFGGARAIDESRKIDGGPDRKNTGALKDWGQTAVALAIVVGMILVLRFVLKRMGRAGGRVGARGVVEVLAQSYLAPRCQLSLVRLGSRLLLIGMGPNGPVTLSEITGEAEVAELLKLTGRGLAAAADAAGRSEDLAASRLSAAAENIKARLAQQKDRA
ncbi:MAG: flagellar biosynthetic protein FliO [Phycisphaerae bacterium]|jgi:flagellar biogenesis protein FliO